MPEAYAEFVANNPFWAVVIILLMGLSIVGAVAWVILGALKKPEDKHRHQ